ncbi:hypothetical protein BST97_14740 [Nonlabens spongiae]|uniref:HTH araC/xylS-type domain-containing protein n=1 Tax=Nonlabens spongiae TaxID=331648 RepID=A0A1W6MNF7_9FLAO|nr:AraC family transcriptional regulator [Nonlabens spongiae]ARN79140.1 hypothetical protein BST97_14740 [Nonlabens spongiae]
MGARFVKNSNVQILTVKSLPVREVLKNIAEQLGGTVQEDCEIFSYTIPNEYGSGNIMGANFPQGLGWIQYMCKFKRDTTINFTVDEIHPLKMIYNLGDSVLHTFADSEEKHDMQRYENLIVASSNFNGHVLKFQANQQIKLNSVEISRSLFNKYWSCNLSDLDSKLLKAILDIEASEEHLMKGPYSLRVAQVFRTIESFDYGSFIKKMFLASKSFEIVAQQLLDFSTESSGLSSEETESLETLREIEHLLENNLSSYVTVKALAQKLNITENKLQKIFKDNTGSTGNEYIKNKRMGAITDLVENSDLSISEIAKLVGIDSTSYLSKIFKEQYGISPKEYRDQMKKARA